MKTTELDHNHIEKISQPTAEQPRRLQGRSGTRDNEGVVSYNQWVSEISEHMTRSLISDGAGHGPLLLPPLPNHHHHHKPELMNDENYTQCLYSALLHSPT